MASRVHPRFAFSAHRAAAGYWRGSSGAAETGATGAAILSRMARLGRLWQICRQLAGGLTALQSLCHQGAMAKRDAGKPRSVRQDAVAQTQERHLHEDAA